MMAICDVMEREGFNRTVNRRSQSLGKSSGKGRQELLWEMDFSDLSDIRKSDAMSTYHSGPLVQRHKIQKPH